MDFNLTEISVINIVFVKKGDRFDYSYNAAKVKFMK